jgi:hypothetical protein
MQVAGGSAPPTQSASRMWRSSNGNLRLDTPQTSIITLPGSQQTIMLDHLKKEAMVIPMPPTPAPSAPGMPQMPGAPKFPPLHVQDLGKSMIEGHEVEGKRFTFSPPPAPQNPQPPQAPQAPQMPKLPQLPKGVKMPPLPKLPQLPKPPQVPKPPQPTVTEVWTSVKLKTPVLTKVTTAAGEQTTYCKPTSTAEPHPSLFQIPPGYKLKPPPAPKLKPPPVPKLKT